MTPIITSRIVSFWIFLIVVSLSLHNKYDFLHFGPRDSLVIFDISINTNFKYIIVLSICFINSTFRTINNNIINSWIINTIQDTTNNTNFKKIHAYEISLSHSIYVWVDFFVYMNIILNQIDFFLIELFSECISTIIITKFYINKRQYINLSILSEH